MYRSVVMSAVVIGAALQPAHAQDPARDEIPRAEISLSNDTIHGRYITKGAEIGVKTARASGGFFLSEERDTVLDAELLFPADLPLGPVSVSFGPRAYAALLQEENNDVMAIAIGAEARFDIDRRMGLAVVGHAFYAPDILTFGTADNLTDFSARAQIRMGPKLTAFAGMRWFELDLTEGGGDNKLQDEVFVGAGYRF